MKISKRTRDALAYIIGGTVVLFGTLLLIAMATGWTYDLKTGELRETGLLLMGSEPTGADISVNDAPLKQKTNYRYSNVVPGSYQLRYSKPDYRPWSAPVSVSAGEVTFADYAWLLPNTIPSNPRYDSYQIISATQTEDRRRFVFVDLPAVSPENSTPQPRLLTSTDLTRPPVVLYAPPAPANATARRVAGFDSLSFSDDNSSLLVRVAYSTGEAEWLIMPASPSDNPKVTNLTTELLIAPSWISWGPRGNNDLYYTEKGNLRRITLNNKALSATLAEQVVYAKWSDQWLTYITDTTAPAERGLYIRTADQDVADKVGTVPRAQTYDARYFRNLDQDFVSVLIADNGNLMLFSNVLRNSSARTQNVTARDVSAYTVSPSGRYLVYNSRDEFATIDFVRFRRTRSNTSLAGLTSWSWMNEEHLALNINGTLRLSDFDGQNNEIISQTFSKTSPILFSENKSLLGLTTAPAADPAAPAKTQLTQFFLLPDKAF